MRRGIILAGGLGTRLYPATAVQSKQLINIYNKPMVYYPLSVLMLAGIQEYMLISSPNFLSSYEQLLGDGSQFGIRLIYQEQKEPKGLPEAFILADSFLNGGSSALILGDNLFFGHGLGQMLEKMAQPSEGMEVLAYPVKNPEDYGVIELSSAGDPLRIVEKPKTPVSNLAIPGIYFCDSHAPTYAKKLIPSQRGELEITDLMQNYLNAGALKVKNVGRGIAWLDTGTPDNLLDASNFVAAIERRQGLSVACLEEIAYHKGWIDTKALEKTISNLSPGHYRSYLETILDK